VNDTSLKSLVGRFMVRVNDTSIEALVDRFEVEMTEGYLDGRNPDNPPPSENRSSSYRHGFENGRDDHGRHPRATAAMLRLMAEKAIHDDIERVTGKPTAAESIRSAAHGLRNSAR
jgi:hypothetical protein